MRLKKNSIGKISVFAVLFLIFNSMIITSTIKTSKKQESFYEGDSFLLTSDGDNNEDLIDQIINLKIQLFKQDGFFSQEYESSIHATYYAIQTLSYLEQEASLDESTLSSYIMNHYDNSTHIFSDKYSDRYLDTDFSSMYYPLTSLLEINCYATLSLNILGMISLIDVQDTIDFIWSCYNPVEHGFIGQPYEESLEEEFKIPTAENTYHAIIALDLLLNDWSGYSDEKDDIISFVNSLQGANGCFKNDEESRITTVCTSDRNMIASYYCIKILDILESIDTMDRPGFRTYLGDSYQPDDHFFKMGEFYPEEEMTLVATAMGLELAGLAAFTNYDKNETIDSVISNRNGLGNWDDGTIKNNHDLWFTFVITRSLYNSGGLENMTMLELDEVSRSMEYYKTESGGYSLISKDYTSIETLNAVVNSLKMEDMYDDLSLQEQEEIFDQVFDSCIVNFLTESMFVSQVNLALDCLYFKTYPIESNSFGSRIAFKDIGMPFSHKSTYLALEILEKTFKLDELNSSYDLSGFIQSIRDSQFLEPGYSVTGGFFPHDTMEIAPVENQEKNVFLEYSYYAIKSLELLTDYIGLGTIVDSGIDCDSLVNYIYRNVVITGSSIYYQPRYTSNIQEILKNTYFAVEILMKLDSYALDSDRIYDFVVQNLNYSNIKNLYYCYKIFEILERDYDFNPVLTKTLVQGLHSEGINDFYVSIEQVEIEQRALFWICEMASSDWITGELSCETTIALGNTINASVSLNGLIYDVDASDYSATFESDQLGTITLIPSGSCLWQEIDFPIMPANYPSVQGVFRVSKTGVEVLEFPVLFTTTCQTNEFFEVLTLYNGTIEINAYSEILVGSSSVAAGLYGFRVYVDIYRDGDFLESIYLNSSGTEDLSRTTYFLSYSPNIYGFYQFDVFYEHPYQEHSELVLTESSSYEGETGVYKSQEDTIVLVSTIAAGFIIVPLVLGGMFFKVRGDLRKKFPQKYKKSS